MATINLLIGAVALCVAIWQLQIPPMVGLASVAALLLLWQIANRAPPA